MVVGDLGPGRVVDQLLRVGVELDPLRGRDRLALVDEAGDERRRAGSSQTRPCVRPVSAPTGFVAALKITLRHCGPRASATAFVGSPARVHASASRSTSSIGAGLGSKGPIVVSPFTSHCTCPGSSTLPAGNVVPRITRSTCARDHLLVADPVLHRADRALARRRARSPRSPARCASPSSRRSRSSHGGQLGRRPRSRADGRRPRPAPESRSPLALIASTWSCAEVVRPHLDVVEQREVRREERPDGAAADDADPHRRRLHERGSRNSRPPVSPDGRRISTSAMIAARKTRREPCGRSSVKPTCTPSSAWLRNESSPLIASAPTTAPQRLVMPPTTSIASVMNVSSR